MAARRLRLELLHDAAEYADATRYFRIDDRCCARDTLPAHAASAIHAMLGIVIALAAMTMRAAADFSAFAHAAAATPLRAASAGQRKSPPASVGAAVAAWSPSPRMRVGSAAHGVASASCRNKAKMPVFVSAYCHDALEVLSCHFAGAVSCLADLFICDAIFIFAQLPLTTAATPLPPSPPPLARRCRRLLPSQPTRANTLSRYLWGMI